MLIIEDLQKKDKLNLPIIKNFNMNNFEEE
jgi:hypothetical protein